MVVADLKGNIERVYLNGKRVSTQNIKELANGLYQLRLEVSLNKGGNTLSIEAFDPDENSARLDIQVIRK